MESNPYKPSADEGARTNRRATKSLHPWRFLPAWASIILGIFPATIGFFAIGGVFLTGAVTEYSPKMQILMVLLFVVPGVLWIAAGDSYLRGRYLLGLILNLSGIVFAIAMTWLIF